MRNNFAFALPRNRIPSGRRASAPIVGSSSTKNSPAVIQVRVPPRHQRADETDFKPVRSPRRYGPLGGRREARWSPSDKPFWSKGWHQFAVALSSAAGYSGMRVVMVPPQYTSQRCSACGHVDPKSPESQAVFRCTRCSHVGHADVNAAKTFWPRGLRSPPVKTLPSPRAGQSRRSRNQQEPAKNYCSNPPNRLEPPASAAGRTSTGQRRRYASTKSLFE
jgi:hypothetical protein